MKCLLLIIMIIFSVGCTNESDEIITVLISLTASNKLSLEVDGALNDKHDYAFKIINNTIALNENNNQLIVASIENNQLNVKSKCNYKIMFDNDKRLYHETGNKNRVHELKKETIRRIQKP